MTPLPLSSAALRYGALGGALTVAWMFAEYALGLHDTDAGRYTGFVSLAIAAWAVYAAVRAAGGAPPALGRALGVGVATSLAAAVVVAAGAWVYYARVNPGMAQRLGTTAAAQAGVVVASAPVTGAVFGLLAWALRRRRTVAAT